MGHSGTDASGRPSGGPPRSTMSPMADVVEGNAQPHRTRSLVPALGMEVIDRSATVTVRDRFRVCALSQLPSPDVARELIRRRLDRAYDTVGFVPPYPTWPIAEPAFADAHDYTPRRLLQLVDRHIRQCLERGSVQEMTTLTARADDRADSAVAPDSTHRRLRGTRCAFRPVARRGNDRRRVRACGRGPGRPRTSRGGSRCMDPGDGRTR